MKAFLEKVFNMKKQKQKELLNEIVNSEDQEQTKGSVEPGKKQTKAEVKEVQHTDTKDD